MHIELTLKVLHLASRVIVDDLNTYFVNAKVFLSHVLAQEDQSVELWVVGGKSEDSPEVKPYVDSIAKHVNIVAHTVEQIVA